MRAWLDANDARGLWSQHIRRVGAVEAYAVNGRVVLVLIFERNGAVVGWDIFTAAGTADITATLADAVRRLAPPSAEG